MAVQIDEVTAEIDSPPAAPAADRNASAPPSPSPEIELRKQRDLLARLEIRAARVRAD